MFATKVILHCLIYFHPFYLLKKSNIFRKSNFSIFFSTKCHIKSLYKKNRDNYSSKGHVQVIQKNHKCLGKIHASGDFASREIFGLTREQEPHNKTLERKKETRQEFCFISLRYFIRHNYPLEILSLK